MSWLSIVVIGLVAIYALLWCFSKLVLEGENLRKWGYAPSVESYAAHDRQFWGLGSKSTHPQHGR